MDWVLTSMAPANEMDSFSQKIILFTAQNMKKRRRKNVAFIDRKGKLSKSGNRTLQRVKQQNRPVSSHVGNSLYCFQYAGLTFRVKWLGGDIEHSSAP